MAAARIVLDKLIPNAKDRIVELPGMPDTSTAAGVSEAQQLSRRSPPAPSPRARPRRSRALWRPAARPWKQWTSNPASPHWRIANEQPENPPCKT